MSNIKIELSDSNIAKIKKLAEDRKLLQPKIKELSNQLLILNVQIQAIANAVISEKGYDEFEFEFDDEYNLIQINDEVETKTKE